MATTRLTDTMHSSSTALRALALLASLVCTAAFATEPPPATDKAVLIAPPEGGVDVNTMGPLFKSIEAALEHCGHPIEDTTPTKLDQPLVASTPIRTISIADGSRYYPMDLIASGNQAIGIVAFEVDALGNPRFAHVDRALPASPRSEFHSAVREMIRDSTFAPATMDGRPVASWKNVKVRFAFSSDRFLDTFLSEPKLHEVLAKARRGDVTSMAVAQYADGLASKEVQLTRAESRDFLVHAALDGFRDARSQLVRWLQPPACRQDPDVQEAYHFMSWHSGSAVALSEATRLLALKDPSTYPDIATLLHGAANATDPFVKMWATGLLATAPLAEIRDPTFALQSALTLNNPEQDPDITEVLAAAQAANGLFDDAVRSETLALTQANKRHWNDAQLRQRLAAYQSHQPWTDYLCDCNGSLFW